MKPKNLSGSAPKGLYKAKSGDGRNEDPSHTIFPIIKHNEDSVISLIGTGFFIAENGVFVTAKHVLMDVINKNQKQKHFISLVQFLGGSYVIRPIIRSTCHVVADIAVGVSAQMKSNKTGENLKNKLLRLTPNIDNLGSRVCTYAYPKSVINHSIKQELHFYPEFYQGIIQDQFPNGRDSVLLPGPCFQTNMHIHGGASGGPVFNSAGVVCGVNSTGYENDALSFVTPIHTIENMLLSDIETPNNTTGQIRVHELIAEGFIFYDQ